MIKFKNIFRNTTNFFLAIHLFISIIMIIVGIILLFISPSQTQTETVGIITFIIGLISLSANYFIHIKKSKQQLYNKIELIKKIPDENWDIVEKEFNIDGSKITYKRKVYHNIQYKNNKKQYNEESLNKLDSIKKIIICPNCGSKNIIIGAVGKCEHCDSYIE